MSEDRDQSPESPPVRRLRRFALRLPEVEEGESCVNRAFRVKGKAFAYLGMKPEHYRLMVKLTDSVSQAVAAEKKRPEAFSVGKHGWITILLPHDEKPTAQLEAWIEESYRALVPAASGKRAATKRSGR